jgi:hemolysin III
VAEPSSVDAPTKPRLRGWLHAGAFVASIPAGIVLIALAPGSAARIGALVYVLALAGQFGVSALYHRGHWGERGRLVMRRLDHSTIFVLIAGTYTPFCLFVLTGRAAWIVLAVVWAGALIGIATKVYRVDMHVLSGFLYLGLGWVAIAVFPSLVSELAGWQIALLVAGGVIYSLGALVLALNRPDPFPRIFGYHEVWHAATIVAAVCIFTVILSVYAAA